MDMDKSGKRLFIDLWVEHQFETGPLAFRAGIPECIIEDMKQGIPVRKNYAEAVLKVLSLRHSRDYSLETVHIVIRRQFQSKSEIADLMQRIDDEYTASHSGLYGLSEGTGKHEIINQKLKYMGTRMQEFGASFDDNDVMEVLANWSNNLVLNNNQQSLQ